MRTSLKLSLIFLVACAVNKPSTNVPKFYMCTTLDTNEKLCIQLWDCHRNPKQHNRWGEWECLKT